MKLSALVFDAYGTLFDVHSVAAECESLFAGRGAALSELWRAKQLQYTWLRSLMGRYADFWQITGDALAYACRALELACSDDMRERLLNQYLRLDAFPEGPAALRALAARHTLAILSNGTSHMLEAVAEHCGVRDTFSAILSVDAVHVYKPDPRAYELAVHALNVPREAIGFVSSNPFDVAGAKTFGLYTVWIHRHAAPFDVLGASPDLEINNLNELLEI